MATDGANIIVCGSRSSSDNKVHYSLNSGTSWSITSNSITNGPAYFSYIGNGTFFIYQYGQSHPSDGTYYKWSSSNPTQITQEQSPLNTGTIVDIKVCEDGATYYTTDTKTYRVYNSQVTECSGTSGSTTVKKLYQFTYVYGKYYALSKDLYSYSDGSDLFISNDGVNFTKLTISDLTNKTIHKPYHILKSDGKLCYAAKRSAGIIYSDHTFERTVFDSTIAEYAGTLLVTNRFHKLD